MKSKQSFLCPMILGCLFLPLAQSASAQITPERRQLLKSLQIAMQQMSPSQRASLPSGVRAVLAYADALDASLISLNPSHTLSSHAALLGPSQPPIPVGGASGPGGTIRISNPNLDFKGSVLAGFSENTTSSSRCGNSVVVGFEDMGTLLNTSGASSDNVAFSADGGNTFISLASLNTGMDPTNILLGEPAVACASPKIFHYASVLWTGIYPNALLSISVSSSTDGGHSWGPPVPVISVNPCCEGLGKPWLAVDPSNPLRMYITFTRFTDGFNIQLVGSNDGGKTWSAPVTLEHDAPLCTSSFVEFPHATGSNIVVGPDGEVYVAWEFMPPQPCNAFDAPFPPREIHFVRSLDHGLTFTAPFKVADVTGIGDATGPAPLFGTPLSFMEGDFLANEYPQLAVDGSNGSSRGTLYLTWSDGKNNIRPDTLAFSGMYAYSDIVFVKSTDTGLTFTAPASVSPQSAGYTGPGRDQFFPGIAVDPLGKLAVCYYDRRNSPTNMSIDRFCSVSLNQGATWQDLRASSPSWPPNQNDLFIFIAGRGIGEYDALASDFMQWNPGFFGAFVIQENGNPNIVARKF